MNLNVILYISNNILFLEFHSYIIIKLTDSPRILYLYNNEFIIHLFEFAEIYLYCKLFN